MMFYAKKYQNRLLFYGVIQKNKSGTFIETRCTILALMEILNNILSPFRQTWIYY